MNKVLFHNRPHEYRAWFCDEMHEDIVLVTYDFNANGQGFGCPLNAGIADFMDHDDGPDAPMILMEFTGMPDEDGTKIFEADFVKTLRSHGYGWLPKGTIAMVIWDKKELCYRLQWPGGQHRLTVNKRLRVVGNYFNNPELRKHAECN